MVNAATKAIAVRGANVAARTNVAAPLSDRDAAERFSLITVEFSSGDLARAARRTKAAAKGWKDASRAPGLASIINIARALPSVRQWLIAEIDAGRSDHDVVGALKALARQSGTEGDVARAMVRAMGIGD
jgi:hypothetical protein